MDLKIPRSTFPRKYKINHLKNKISQEKIMFYTRQVTNSCRLCLIFIIGGNPLNLGMEPK